MDLLRVFVRLFLSNQLVLVMTLLGILELLSMTLWGLWALINGWFRASLAEHLLYLSLSSSILTKLLASGEAVFQVDWLNSLCRPHWMLSRMCSSETPL